MRKPLKVQQVVHFFPLTPSSASTAAVSIRAELHTALPIPTSSRRCSASDLPALPAKNQYTEPKLPNFQICCWPLCYDFNGFGVRTLRSSPFFTIHPPIYHLPFQVWPLHAQILLKSSFHPFLLFTFAQNHCPEPPLYFSLVCSFPSLSVQKTTRQRLCTSQTFFPQSGAKGKQQLAIPSHYKDTNSLRICRNQGASCPGKHPLLPAGVWLYVSSTF